MAWDGPQEYEVAHVSQSVPDSFGTFLRTLESAKAAKGGAGSPGPSKMPQQDERGTEIRHLLMLEGGPRTLAEIANESPLPPTQLYRLLSSLQEAGFVQLSTEDPPRYALSAEGERLVAMGPSAS